MFISVNGGVCGDGSSGRRMDIGAGGEMIRKYSKLAGLDHNLNAHSFRHFLGRRLAERGMDGLLISQVLGHDSPESSRIYTNLYSDKLRNVFRQTMSNGENNNLKDLEELGKMAKENGATEVYEKIQNLLDAGIVRN